MTPISRINGPPARVLVVDAEHDQRDTVVLGISIAITLMAIVVIVGWHAHIPALIQISSGFIPMQYNTALCFLALGAAGVGLSTRRRRPEADDREDGLQGTPYDCGALDPALDVRWAGGAREAPE